MKILLVVILFTFVGGMAQAREASMTQKFAAEKSSSVNPMADNLSKLKNGVGIRFNPDAVFGISVNRGVKFGFNVKF